METLFGAALGMTLRKLSDDARNHIKIVSPYIGHWPAVSALLGGNWWLGSTVTLEVITDISDPRNVHHGTLLQLLDRGFVRTLQGVHAKIYIIDERAIVTSANLTGTGFTKRREIGILLDAEESADVMKVFNAWWGLAKEIPQDSIAEWERSPKDSGADEGVGLPTLWSLPARPSTDLFASGDRSDRDFASYRQFLQHYKQLAHAYERVQRLWPEAPRFLEIDALLNYLFHDAKGIPSFAYYTQREPRALTDSVRTAEIERWAGAFANWVQRSSHSRWREERAATVQKVLARDRIDDLDRAEVQEVVDCLNCMMSHRLNRHKFLNPANNELTAIRGAWKELVHGKGREEERMQRCKDALRFFGTSSVQELLGWYYPDRYPIRNENSDAGLRFFGFRI